MGVDLTTTYLGLTLRNPIIASASPLALTVAGIQELQAAGAGAIVLPSLFEEQIRSENIAADWLAKVGADSTSEVGSYFPNSVPRDDIPHHYLDLVARAVKAVNVPIIASLNGTSVSGWIDYASQVEAAGAAAIELNIYRVATNALATSGQVELDCLGLVMAIRAQVKIPLAVKLHPYYSAFGALARQLDEAGANGIVLFNRLYARDMDLTRLAWTNDVALSQPQEARLGLLWLSQLYGQLPHASLGAGTGVETAEDVIKYLLAGADVVMTTSSLLRHGPRHLKTLLSGLETWIAARKFRHVDEIRGLMRDQGPGIAAEQHERSGYIRSLTTYRGPYVHS